ncbi:MAG TPA: LLM class flavin-dependent oxidoreductase [Candidatus Dormibacteraeota bacterium]|nr:LLM class flavin-dependent oxidoreductase [Candidatus Dormibacteraeota bacterium]
MAKLGIMIEGQEGLSWERWRRICTDVERLGFASLRRSDHLISLMGDDSRDCIDCWASLALAAEWTKTIEFGPMVSPMTFYEPAVLARRAAAVDGLSGGRLILGVGAGWNEREHELLHVPFLDVKGRMDRLEQGVSIIKATWTKSHPRPVRGGKIPVLMGGVGEKRHLPIVAREADEWNYTRFNFDEYRHKREVLDRCCKEIGRNPASLRYSVMMTYVVGRDQDDLRGRAAKMQQVLPRVQGLDADGVLQKMRESAFVGTPEEVAGQIREYARLGVELFMLQHFLLDDTDELELLAKEVMPAVA